MAAMNERNISRFLFNPFSVYVAAVGDSQPAVPSFYTDPGITFSFNKEFVAATAYNTCSGVLYTVRQDIKSFGFRASFSIKETTPKTLQLAHGGTLNTSATTLTLDGSVTNYAFWFESCYNDTNDIIRITVPQAKNVESSEMATGADHAMQTVNIQALPNITNTATLPTIYIEA